MIMRLINQLITYLIKLRIFERGNNWSAQTILIQTKKQIDILSVKYFVY